MVVKMGTVWLSVGVVVLLSLLVTTEALTQEQLDFICSEGSSDQYYFAHPLSCKRFIQCDTSRTGFDMPCADYNCWNQDLLTQDYCSNVDCRPERCCCYVVGDPHYHTYDDNSIHFQGECRYTITETCFDPAVHPELTEFTIEGINYVDPNFNTGRSWPKEIYIDVFEMKFKLDQGDPAPGLAGPSGPPKAFKFVDDWELIFYGGGPIEVCNEGRCVSISLNDDNFIVFEFDFGVIIDWGEHRFTRRYKVNICIPGTYRGMLCGMCGTCNGDKDDDFSLKDGTYVGDLYDSSSWAVIQGMYDQIGESWLVPDPSLGPECQAPGGRRRKRQASSEQRDCEENILCDVIKNVEGVFGRCAASSLVNSEEYYVSCAIDVCSASGDEATLPEVQHEVACGIIETYAKACEEAGLGVFPGAWREVTDCPLHGCNAEGYNMRYNASMTSCPASCVNPSGSEQCASQEGCQCLAGYVRSGHLCVPRDRCGCEDATGGYHQLGDTWASRNCTHWYMCVEPNQIEEIQSPCGVGSQCQLVDGLWTCTDSIKTTEPPVIV
ncbi:zonadhesin [Lingula anatina]|uniref:Zonadhesin n=1 Tax=Lingula anatina TaxID=7574 RepID=A0A1S3HNI9_LINAN|nr:zonadhesin [Lingula anatina]|eukprot:XP_013387096.1 zonadhesin [Lingula anatina]